MDQDATWYIGKPRPRHHCVRWGPSFPTERGTAPPYFSAHVYCGQMVAHLSNCWAFVQFITVDNYKFQLLRLESLFWRVVLRSREDQSYDLHIRLHFGKPLHMHICVQSKLCVWTCNCTFRSRLTTTCQHCQTVCFHITGQELTLTIFSVFVWWTSLHVNGLGASRLMESTPSTSTWGRIMKLILWLLVFVWLSVSW